MWRSPGEFAEEDAIVRVARTVRVDHVRLEALNVQRLGPG
jgi:hypothetical protein